MNTSLISQQHRVESPFVIIHIGKYTFGHCQSSANRGRLKVTYPNYVTGISIKKINGSLNTYTIRMVYAIRETDDPNMLEKVFSSISETRKITLEYGDWSLPSYIYKNEEAILGKVTSSVDFANSRIEYTLNATSCAIGASGITDNFPAMRIKPSDRIKQLLKNKAYQLTEIFYGMKHLNDLQIAELIPGNDKEVNLQAQKNMSVISYLNYLVSCMTSTSDKEAGGLKQTRYYWATFDDTSGKFGGPYFKIIPVRANSTYNPSYDCYELDIGYPSASYVSSFSIETNDVWSLMYKTSTDIQLPSYVYDIDNNGNISTTYSPMITNSPRFGITTETSKSWWSNMTQYPISAKVTIKGLLKPAILMSYVKINVYFYGKKHISSGMYIIKKQEDTIDTGGYKTTLSITRVGGDE